MATTLNRTFYGGSTVPGSGVYPEDVKILKVFANYAETDYDPLASSDTSVYIPTVDKQQYDDDNIVSIIDRVLAAGGSPIVTKLGAEFTYTSYDANKYKFVNVSGDNITEMTIDRDTGTVTTRNSFLTEPAEVVYGVDTASTVGSIININGLPYVKAGDVIARLYKIETNKYTFRTTHLRVDDDINYLDIVDYIVNGASWTTVTKTVSGGNSGTAYLKKVSSPSSFDTTGLYGMQTVVGVNDVPTDGVYQVSVMLSVTPKTASATKGDLVFGFYGADGIGMADNTFHAVVDDSQTFAQQLSFSTTLNLKAGTNSLKLSCDGLNTNYIVFVDDLTVAQLVNGVYHNGDEFADVHTLTEAPDFNNDDGVLVDGATGGPRFMLWQTLANKVLGFIKSLFTTITSFRTGDYIAVDGPSGTAKMSKDDLLQVTAENAVGSRKTNTGTITSNKYDIVTISAPIGTTLTISVTASTPVNLVVNNSTILAFGITGVHEYTFTTTSENTKVGFYLYSNSCTYSLDVFYGGITENIVEIQKDIESLNSEIGRTLHDAGTLTANNFSVLSVHSKIGDVINIDVTASTPVNLVVNNSTILAYSITSGMYKFVATSTTTNIGFYLYDASCDYTLDVIAGDNIKNDVIELGYTDKNLQKQIGQKITDAGTLTANNYNLVTIQTKVGDVVNVQVGISSPVNLVVNNAAVVYGVSGSYNYQFVATSTTTNIGFYLYDASCDYSIVVTYGDNLNNEVKSIEKNIGTLGITKTLKTKELLVLGDSISVTTGYFKFLKNYFAKANSVAVAGATWADHSDTDAYNGTPTSEVYKYNVMGNQVQKVKNNSSSYNPDFIILSAGTNDDTPNSDYPSEDLFTHNDSYVSLGTPTFDASDSYMLNRRTIGGAMRYCITELEKLYPNAKIIVLTPIQASNSLRAYWTIARRQNYISSTAHRMASFVADVGKNCGIYGDFEWNGSSWTELEPDSREGRDLSDGLHPNDSGRKKMSDYIFSQICTMVS